jgi:hypothetical protein
MRTHIHRWVRRLGWFAALAAMALAGAGCGVGTPNSPGAGVAAAKYSAVPDATATPNWYVVTQKWVEPGVPTTVSGSHYTVKFASGSLKAGTEITIREYDPNVVDFELLPHGTQFGTPVTVVVDYKGTSLDPFSPHWNGTIGLPVLLWLNPATLEWELVPGINNPLTRTLTVRLSHFSRYAVGVQAGTGEWN